MRRTVFTANFPSANSSIIMQKLTIKKIFKHTPDVWSFFLDPKPDFVAGQVAVLGMDGYKSSYLAFASAPEDTECEFLVRRSEHETTLAYGLFNHDEASVKLENIIGNGFSLEEHRGADVLFLAMGTGIAPLRSTLRHLFHARGDYGKLTVLHGIRQTSDQYFISEINDEWRKQEVFYQPIVSRPEEDWSGEKGYVHDFLEKIIMPSAKSVALLCGSLDMMKQSREKLNLLGMSDDQILTNY
jgi:NAD(P)H-flavin reductase